jgi:hypothetical protein
VVTYVPCSVYRRTPLERADQFVSWQRPDVAFFAAGACHILAFAFLATYPDAGFDPVMLWGEGEPLPCHLFVSDGEWAFDHNGWTPTAELLAAEPDAGYSALPVDVDLLTYCARYRHRDRDHFAFDPWDRALRYIAGYPPPGQHDGGYPPDR